MQIIQAGLNDIHDIQNISRRTFEETFAAQNSPDDLQLFMDRAYSTDSLQKQLENPESVFYLVRSDNEWQGYMKLNRGFAQTEDQGPDALEVERIYVLKQFHGFGIGKRLLQYAFEYARQLDLATVWLGVWDKNFAAIRFYEKQGFVVFGEHTFMFGDDPQRDLLMKSGTSLQ